MIDMAKVPPHSLEAETAVIGAALLNNEVFTHITLSPEDFYRSGHQTLFRTMMALEATGSPVDLVTLAERVKSEGNLERVGGLAYISSLTNQIPSIANAEHHAAIVKEKAQRRRVIQSCQEIAQEAYEDTDIEEINSRVLGVIDRDNRDAGGYRAKEVMQQVFDTMEAGQKGEGVQTVKTGLIDLDKMVSIRNGNFVLIAGRPGMGKTSFVVSVARHVAKSLPVAFFSLEMSALEVGQVMVSQDTRVSREKLYTGQGIKDSDYPKLSRAAGLYADLPFQIFDRGGIAPTYVRKQSKLMQKKTGLGLVIIDYLQLMRSGIKNAGRYEDVTEISISLKALAKELDVPVICLSQLNRMVEERPDKKPRLSDLRESGSLEQDADTVLMCFRPDHYWPVDDPALIEAMGGSGKKAQDAAEEMQKRRDNKNIMKIFIPKQRAGRTGEVSLQWDGEATNVHTLDKWR